MKILSQSLQPVPIQKGSEPQPRIRIPHIRFPGSPCSARAIASLKSKFTVGATRSFAWSAFIDEKGTASPLTPALSPLRGEGELLQSRKPRARPSSFVLVLHNQRLQPA